MNDWRLSSGPLRAFLINLGYFTLFASTILVPAILCFVFNPLEFGDVGPATVRLHNRTNVRVKVFENNQWGPTPDDIRAAEIAELDPGESKETGWVFPLKPSYRVEDEHGNTIYCGPFRRGEDDFHDRSTEGVVRVEIQRQANVTVEIVSGKVLCEP